MVTVDVFSGRPDNPTFALDAARAEPVLAIVDELEVVSSADFDDGGLGFRGVTSSRVALLRPHRPVVPATSAK